MGITGRHPLIAFGGAVVAALWLLMASPALAQLSFSSSVFPGGDTPIGVTISDFNDDRHLDLAVANNGYPFFNSGGVVVLLGGGNGSFRLVKQFDAHTRPSALVSADFDADTHPDVAVANQGSDDVSLLRGVGDGTFGAPNNVAVGGGPAGIVAAFLNSDRHPDLAVANSGASSNNVSILLGTGDGSFSPATNIPVGTTPDALAAGDFNDDTNLDLVVANALGGGSGSVLLGRGDGSFRDAMTFPTGRGPESVAVGDFDGDTIPDLAFAISDPGLGGTLAVLLGAGDGSFGKPTKFQVGSSAATGVAAADFNADSVTDLVTTVPTLTGQEVNVLLGVGNGTFGSPLRFAANGSDSVSVGNFDANPRPDLVTTEIGAGLVAVLLSNPPAPSPAPTLSVAPGGSCQPGRRQATLGLRVADASASAGRLALSVASSNHALVPTRKIRVAGRGARRTLTAKAVSGRRGLARVRIRVSDGRSTRSLAVRVHVGGRRADRFSGGPGTDVMLAQAGADMLAGRGGNDLLCGGKGADRISGGAGADLVCAGRGADLAAGGRGRDRGCR
jgi:FG-GAP-like repeat/RTX calcium-binding nonapeptide repeat (4 copies)